MGQDVSDALDRRIASVRSSLTAPGARFSMQTVEVRGQALRVFAEAPASLADIWESAAAFGDRDYLVFENERITYAQARVATSSVATWLDEQGVGPGDRVAIAMRNYPEWLLAFWACVSVGAAVVALNAWWTEAELLFAIAEAEPKVVFADAERIARLPSLNQDHSTVIVAVRTAAIGNAVAWENVVQTSPSHEVHHCGPDDDACIFYTSGTTGIPKGAQLTHRGCSNTITGIAFAFETGRLLAEMDASEPIGELPPPVALVTTPLFHVTACNTLAHPVTAFGGTIVLMYKWDAGEALRLIEAERVTTTAGVPTMTRELLAHPDLHHRDVSSLTTLSGGGAPVPPDQVARIGDHRTPMQPSTGFGMTETCGLVSSISGEAYVRRPTSCGLPLPTFDVLIVDDAGSPLSAGGVGELLVRGPGVIKGYLRQPEATAAAIVEGWLRTGDVGRLDLEGYIHIVDRKKDMILRGGENVYCAEVEAALYDHPAVAEACVFGAPDERLGEAIVAVVFPHAGRDVEERELREHASGRLAAFKVPRDIRIAHHPLPRNASGKIVRSEVRAAGLSGPRNGSNGDRNAD